MGIEKRPIFLILYTLSTPMTRSARRKLFYALLALFFILGIGVVFYAQGWRFDFATRRFDKVGAIYVRAFPADAAIFLNGKPVQSQVGFLSRGTLISDLFPKTYSLKLAKAGFLDWHEAAGVLPSLVTEFKYAVLIPQDATSAPSGTIADFLAAQKSAIALNGAGTAAARASVIKKARAASTSIILYDPASKNIIATSTALAGANQKIAWVRGNTWGVLQANGSLYLYDGDARAFRKLADDVRDFSSSADGSMVAALENKSVEIFSLDDPSGYYRFNLPNLDGIKQLAWYRDDSHLFVAYAAAIDFLDLADSGLHNFTAVANGSSSFYDPKTNVLYVLNPNREWMQYNFPE